MLLLCEYEQSELSSCIWACGIFVPVDGDSRLSLHLRVLVLGDDERLEVFGEVIVSES